MSLEKLNKKIFGNSSELSGLFELARELGCLPDIIGRKYEVYDSKGKLAFTIVQKALTIQQLMVLFSEFKASRKREAKQFKTRKK